MYQRKEKTERQVSQEGVLELFNLLESSNILAWEAVKNMIYENLSATKDSKFLYELVDYYIAVQSERCLDVLLRVKDPHDKHLFDKINELMKSESSRYQSLQLLCKLVYKQPSWLHKIASHKVMQTIYFVLKNDTFSPNLISALFIITCLLPMIPSHFGQFLQETFEVFSRLVSWNFKKPTVVSETCILHLQIGVYSLFHRLYGMFPCNFLAYLRSYYGGRDGCTENFRIFTSYIKPMLERVRLHPLLVTASKEAELSAVRWKKMAYHDIIVDCASISLDAVEGTLESVNRKKFQTEILQNSCTSAQDSMQFTSLSSQSSTMSASLESTSAVTDVFFGNQGPTWSPSHSYGFATPPASAHLLSPFSSKNEPELKTHLSIDESISLDYAVEAKPEILKSDQIKQYMMNDRSLHKTISKDSKSSYGELSSPSEKLEQIELYNRLVPTEENGCATQLLTAEKDKNVFQAAEAKEEDIDKEVSELTCSQKEPMNLSPTEVRHDTPFCSTTQNLTDEPTNTHKVSISSSGHSDSLTKSNDDDTDEMYNSLTETDVETFLPPFGRFRYFSHCGLPPDIPQESIKKPKAVRSLSCPPSIFPTLSSLTILDDRTNEKAEIDNSACTTSVLTTSSSFVSHGKFAQVTNYEQLIPMVVSPHQQMNSSVNLDGQYGSTIFPSLSPPELLDHYLRMGNVTYLKQLNSIPIPSMKNTDWTHFDGKPPPDELAILRNEVLLLHNQLLFERHRKDVHSERNRRILGRAKRARMQEEHIEALKGQISLLEKHKQDFVKKNESMKEQLRRVQNEKQLLEAELTNHISKICQEKSQLLFINKKLQSFISSKNEETEKILALCQKCQSEARSLRSDLEVCQEDMKHCERIKEDSELMSKQMMLLQELLSHNEDRIELLKKPPQINVAQTLLEEAKYAEIKDLKQKLESKNYLLDATKGKIADMEMTLSLMKVKHKEVIEAIEHMKLLHKDEIEVREERLRDMTRVAIQKDSYILELHRNIETLSNQSSNLEQKQSALSYSCTMNQMDMCTNNDEDSWMRRKLLITPEASPSLYFQ